MQTESSGGRHIEDLTDAELGGILSDPDTGKPERRTVATEIARRRRPAADQRNGVILAGVDIPFGDLVVLFVKAALAAIPAVLILVVVSVTVGVVITAVVSGNGSR